LEIKSKSRIKIMKRHPELIHWQRFLPPSARATSMTAAVRTSFSVAKLN
jgi:hypothetical protein